MDHEIKLENFDINEEDLNPDTISSYSTTEFTNRREASTCIEFDLKRESTDTYKITTDSVFNLNEFGIKVIANGVVKTEIDGALHSKSGEEWNKIANTREIEEVRPACIEISNIYSIHEIKNTVENATVKLDNCLRNLTRNKNKRTRGNICSVNGNVWPSKQKGKIKDNAINTHFKWFMCAQCTYSTHKKDRLILHTERMHEKNKYGCKHCTYTCSIKNYLKFHIAVVHDNLEIHKCAQCGFAATSFKGLRAHKKVVHEDVSKHACEYCKYTAARYKDIKKHIGAIHEKIKSYKCNQCYYSASDKSNLSKHLKAVHKRIKNHKCSICQFSFDFESRLKIHQEEVHMKKHKKYKCDKCENAYIRKYDLITHTEATHLKNKIYRCDGCENFYSSKSQLIKHIEAVHLKNQKFQL